MRLTAVRGSTLRGRDVLRGSEIVPFVYILRCRDGSFYTGAARDLPARVRKHEAGTASRYTRARRPVVLVWSRRVRTWGRALGEEIRIKGLKRRDKEALVSTRMAGA